MYNIDEFNKQISNFLIDCDVSIIKERKNYTSIESKEDMVKLQNIIYNNTVHIEDIEDIYKEVVDNKEFRDVEVLDNEIIKDCAAPMGINNWYVDTYSQGIGDSLTISYIQETLIWWHVIKTNTTPIYGNNPLHMHDFVTTDDGSWWFGDLIDYNIIPDYSHPHEYFGFFKEGLTVKSKQNALLNWIVRNPMEVKE